MYIRTHSRVWHREGRIFSHNTRYLTTHTHTHTHTHTGTDTYYQVQPSALSPVRAEDSSQLGQAVHVAAIGPIRPVLNASTEPSLLSERKCARASLALTNFVILN